MPGQNGQRQQLLKKEEIKGRMLLEPLRVLIVILSWRLDAPRQPPQSVKVVQLCRQDLSAFLDAVSPTEVDVFRG